MSGAGSLYGTVRVVQIVIVNFSPSFVTATITNTTTTTTTTNNTYGPVMKEYSSVLYSTPAELSFFGLFYFSPCLAICLPTLCLPTSLLPCLLAWADCHLAKLARSSGRVSGRVSDGGAGVGGNSDGNVPGRRAGRKEGRRNRSNSTTTRKEREKKKELRCGLN